MKIKKNNYYKKNFKNLNKINQENYPIKFKELLFWSSQIIVVLFEYAFVITLFVLMIKNLFTDDYNDPYFTQQIPGGFDKWYGIQLLALKFIIWIKNLFI